MDRNHYQQCITQNIHSSYYLSGHGVTMEPTINIPNNTQILFLTEIGGKLDVRDLRNIINSVNYNPESRQAFFESLCDPSTRLGMSRALRVQKMTGPSRIQLTPYQQQIPEMIIDFWLVGKTKVQDTWIRTTEPAGFINFAQSGSADAIPIPKSIETELARLPKELRNIWTSSGKKIVLNQTVKEYIQQQVIPRMFQPTGAYVNPRSNALVNHFIERCDYLTSKNLENQRNGLFDANWKSLNPKIEPFTVKHTLLIKLSTLVNLPTSNGEPMLKNIQLLAMGVCRGCAGCSDENIMNQRINYEVTSRQSRSLENSAMIDQYCNSQLCSGPTAIMAIPGLTYCQTLGCGVCNIIGRDNQLYCSTCPETQAVIIPGKTSPVTKGQTCDICYTLDDLVVLALEWTTAWPNKEDIEIEGTNIGILVCTIPWQILYTVMALKEENVQVELGDEMVETVILPQMTVPYEAFVNASVQYLQHQTEEGYKKMVAESLNMIEVCIEPFVHIDPRLLHKILMSGVIKGFEYITATFGAHYQYPPVLGYLFQQLNEMVAMVFANGVTILEPVQTGACQVDTNAVNQSRTLSELLRKVYNHIIDFQ